MLTQDIICEYAAVPLDKIAKLFKEMGINHVSNFKNKLRIDLIRNKNTQKNCSKVHKTFPLVRKRRTLYVNFFRS